MSKRTANRYFWPTVWAVALHLGVAALSLVTLPRGEATPESSAIVQARLISTETRTDKAQQVEAPPAAAGNQPAKPAPEPRSEPAPPKEQKQKLEQKIIDQARDMATQRKQKALEQAKASARAEAERRTEKARQKAREAAERKKERAQAEARRKREAAEKAAAEQAAQEKAEKARQKREAEEKRRQAQAAKERAEQQKREREAAEAALQRKLEGEQQAAAKARQAEKAANSFIAVVRSAVEQAWRIPPRAGDHMRATVRVRLGPSGEVLAATVAQSSGSDGFDNAAVQAVEAAAPFAELLDLPSAQQAELRRFNLRFTPGEIR